jgi:hypothetical protein
MSQLRTCDGCSRHVWMSERACPFCKCELVSACEPERSTTRVGLSRGQRLMLAAAIAGQALGACAETTQGPEVRADGGPIAGSAASAGNMRTAGEGSVAVTGGKAGPMPTPPYGASPPPPPDKPKDAGPPGEDAGTEDAGTEDAGP